MITSLRDRLGLLFVAFFLLVSVSVGATFLATETQRKDALVINLAGRQRMLLQSMARYALQLERGMGESRQREALAAAAALFDSTLQALEAGGPASYTPGQTVILPPPSRNAAVQVPLARVREGWTVLKAEIDRILASSPTDALFTPSVSAVLAQSLPLIQAMDEVVRAFEQEATARVQRLRLIQGLFLASAVSLLLVGYGLTFSTVIRPLRMLQQIALEIGHGQLTKPVPALGRDEIGQLARNLEIMRGQLVAARDHLEAQVAQRTRELEALNDVSREISARLAIGHVLRSVTDKAHALLGAEVAALCLLDESNNALSLEAVSGPRALLGGRRDLRITMPVNGSLVGQVLAAKRAVVCDVEHCEGWCAVLHPSCQSSHLAAPLRIGERVIGALCVGSSKKNAFSADALRLLTRLADSAAIALENARLYEQAERIGTLEERQRIAAEIHDGTAQNLGYMGLKVDTIIELAESGRIPELIAALQDLRGVINQASLAIRRSIAKLQEVSPAGHSLQERLARTVAEIRSTCQAEVELVCELREPIQMPVDREEQVVRVVQEALTNACRHANANHITVRLSGSGHEARIVIEDDGCGFDPDRPKQDEEQHFGLSIMRARASRLQGRLTIDSAPGRGTRVTLSWSSAELEATTRVTRRVS